ncbi:16S rRNA (adenine(1518)-N(6)/adenine(1519)-N(6))-dimethyltransferase RsmA [Stackebrandtia nassauensis]|uniref:Ribosomal RNA small subunit methyltransferase A n=1 Tax=Stackebrandtia nassauensis (strain DSM 44728 / CIP 108903 / NRRL B-16338 / NBRC 102104 / LLR-40K-21) TaxID=446470 RepID=D3QA06_STANL|nr:16S rRNA (adenine(1518)-N(6)/adenine(1519)-N(6))-dimethyltransferase RsmA [Stackebrandtia nassauensis]ADD40718.1 dimethyladenosine transferase [Stackebrandtia nassauensis DSM 44728]
MTELLGAADIRRIAEALTVRPAKALGQNFVIDGNTVRRIAEAAKLSPDDIVIEVGPGLGSLTLALLPKAKRVHAVEIDARLASALTATVNSRAGDDAAKLRVHHADAMTVAEDGFDEPPTALVANLPYNVAVPVVLHLLASLPSLRQGLVMVQSEVAERLTAKPGTKIYGIPSLKLAWYASARRAGTVPRGVFWPVPNVDSGLVAFERREPPPGDRREVFAAVDAAFAQRRKTLRIALSDWAGGPDRAEAILRAADVDPRTRGEALDITTFARIARERTAT